MHVGICVKELKQTQRKLLALNAYIRKENSKINDLRFYDGKLEIEEENKHKANNNDNMIHQ